MEAHVYLLHLLAGGLLANAVPHFVQGISGRPFQSPFASPPGVGLSSPVVNVAWGFANFAAGYCLLTVFGPFSFALSLDALIVGLGAFGTASLLAHHFGRLKQRGQGR